MLEAIHAAVLDELHDHGYAGVTFEGVARRARTSKPVLYRRYRSRAHLVTDAVLQSAADQTAWKQTGSLRGDLIALLSGLADQFERFGGDTYLGLLSEADENLIGDALETVGTVNHEAMLDLFDAARQRGELGPAPISEQVAAAPVSLIRHGALLVREFGAETIVTIVDEVVIPLLKAVSGTPSS
ncbi:TetR/AcrR family transcriptional regulator [Microbacterium sp. STN6]|uniref:TetR/AcrR family transcriptional regulator n=1 Tax=Microbacterium sp. STN6 TaxID=2995588 RepID=UPI002260B182|nr:TetR/AcrR family transcriptional regulator [Microbacterium sp. STN6]MCX7523090.1 TetR/AcrR family transcriptional regulator [Microbacterium sp. STN6]